MSTKRLREAAHYCGSTNHAKLMLEAANEIDGLVVEIIKLREKTVDSNKIGEVA